MTGEELLQIRKNRKWTRKKAAAEWGVSESAIVKWERDENPIPEPVAKLARVAMNLPFDIEAFKELVEVANEEGIELEEAIASFVREGLERRKKG